MTITQNQHEHLPESPLKSNNFLGKKPTKLLNEFFLHLETHIATGLSKEILD
jgi:hypothetical protein